LFSNLENLQVVLVALETHHSKCVFLCIGRKPMAKPSWLLPISSVTIESLMLCILDDGRGLRNANGQSHGYSPKENVLMLRQDLFVCLSSLGQGSEGKKAVSKPMLFRVQMPCSGLPPVLHACAARAADAVQVLGHAVGDGRTKKNERGLGQFRLRSFSVSTAFVFRFDCVRFLLSVFRGAAERALHLFKPQPYFPYRSFRWRLEGGSRP
jgi:hypothetical protein